MHFRTFAYEDALFCHTIRKRAFTELFVAELTPAQRDIMEAIEELTESDQQWLAAEADKLSGGRNLLEVGGDKWQVRYMQTISRDHMRNFFDCVKSRDLPASDIFSHHRVLNCCHMCTMAIKLKRKLKWDPAKEAFIGDDEANAMLQREQREPYGIQA